MRVLLTTPSSTERLHNLVPLGWGFRTAGHEVQIAAPPGFTPAINRTGLVAVGAGAADPTDDTNPLADFAALWKPDLVIWDRNAPAGSVAARACGALSVRMLGVLDHAEGRRLDAGLEPERTLTGDVTVDTTPPALLPEPGSGGLRVRYIPYSGPAVVPAWLRRKPRLPRICVAATTAGRALNEVFAAVGGLAAEVICVASAESIAAAGTVLPDNVRLFDSLPLDSLLPTCRAVVHDGSASMSAAALAYGLPYLDLAGRTAAPPGGCLDLLLNDPAARADAARARAAIQAMPSPRDIVPQLVAAATAERAVGPDSSPAPDSDCVASAARFRGGTGRTACVASETGSRAIDDGGRRDRRAVLE